MSAIVTSNMRIHAAKQFIGSFLDGTQSLYLFIAKTTAWDNENSPPSPVDSEKDQSTLYREMLSLKRINGNDVAQVVSRNNWTVNTVYSEYDSAVDLFDPNSPNPPFFVVTDSLNVYKCLNNNGGAVSTVAPSGTTTSVVTNADGYQWKYMYTVNSADVLKFVTTDWIPVKTLLTNDGSQQWLVQQAAVPGTIDRIDVLTAGTQYTQVPTITITGDGTGATAIATIDGGNVTGITVTATGSGYTYATIAITNGGVASNGATAAAIISPFGGHGSNPEKELGGYDVLVNCKLTFDESGAFTVSNDYRRLGILKNPTLNASGGTRATALDYDQTTRLTFTTVSGSTFNQDEIVTGNQSGAAGVVLDWDSGTSVLRLATATGTFTPGETVVGASASGVLLTYTGTAASATGTTIVLPNGASSVNDTYTGQTIKITSGTGVGQVRLITSYVGVSRTATVAAWSVTPNNTSVFKIAKILSPAIQPYSGDILYMENRRPIQRASDQVEDIRITVEF